MKMKKTKKHLAFMLALVLMISCFTMESVFAQSETAGTVIVGSRKYEAVFYNNPAAEELVSKMPFEISMSELNGNEKYKYLDYSLPGNEQAVGQIQAGDIMLYGNDCLVVFYKSLSGCFLQIVSNILQIYENRTDHQSGRIRNRRRHRFCKDLLFITCQSVCRYHSPDQEKPDNKQREK